MNRLLFAIVLLAFSGHGVAEVVTVEYRGTIMTVDPVLAAGPFTAGQVISGSYTYDTDPIANPDTSAASNVGRYAIASVSSIRIDAVDYPAAPSFFGITIFDNAGVDGWDATFNATPPFPVIGTYQSNTMFVSLRDSDGSAFSGDVLPASPPPLGNFTSRRLAIQYAGPGGVAFVEALVELHAKAAGSVVTLPFSGPVSAIFTDTGAGQYAGVTIGDEFSGDFRIGADDSGSGFEPPDTYTFPASTYYGTLTRNSLTASTEGSVDPMQVRFSNDIVASQDILDLLDERLGVNLPPGTLVDLAELETTITEGNRRIEFGVSFISLDLTMITDGSYQPFPTLDAADAAVYFVVEELGDVEVLNLLGDITAFGTATPPAPASIPALPGLLWLMLCGALLGAGIGASRGKPH
ncbi:MAG: hypothetical protein KJO38_07660 [Gammaproteobacteria bacterium]|nr:hypothetical protein [Gammaproteobacteria bacterium]